MLSIKPLKITVCAMIKHIKQNLQNYGALIIFLTVCFFLYHFLEDNHLDYPPKVVEVETATLKNLIQTTKLIGTVRSRQASMLSAKAAGIITLLARSGTEVKQHTIIAKITNSDIEKNYELSVVAEKIAHEQFKRVSTLLKSAVISRNAVEEKKNAWIESQKALINAKKELNKIMLYAPFDGMVGAFKMREGTQVKEGESIVSFYDPYKLVVDFDIPSSIINFINNNQEVHINNKMYALNYVQKMLDDETHMCPAHVDIDCKDCIIGTAVYVELVVQERKNIIIIPFEALFLHDGKTFVYVLEEDKIVPTTVEVGLRQKELVEIISGLNVGAQFVSRNPMRLYPYMTVKVHQND